MLLHKTNELYENIKNKLLVGELDPMVWARYMLDIFLGGLENNVYRHRHTEVIDNKKQDNVISLSTLFKIKISFFLP